MFGSVGTPLPGATMELSSMQRFNPVDQASAEYIEGLYARYQADPRSVDEGWKSYFESLDGTGGLPGFPAGEGVPLTIGVHNLVHTYRELGHFIAKLDPLGHDRPSHPLLELSQFNITAADLDRHMGKADFYGQTDGTIRDLVAKLRDTYCRTI